MFRSTLLAATLALGATAANAAPLAGHDAAGRSLLMPVNVGPQLVTTADASERPARRKLQGLDRIPVPAGPFGAFV